MAQFEPPPTYADVIIEDDKTGKGVFNPLWLRWFLDLASFVKSPSGGSVSLLDDAVSVLSNRAYGEFPSIPMQFAIAGNTTDTVLMQRTFVPPIEKTPVSAADTQHILATQIFGT